MSANEDAMIVYRAVSGLHLEGIDIAPAVALALGMIIAEQCFPRDPFTSIVSTGALIGAGASFRRAELVARGNMEGGAA